jgi:hypothetical protein
MILLQITLVGFKQKAFDSFSLQEEQFPVGQIDQLCSRWLQLLQVEGGISEGLDWKMGWSDLLPTKIYLAKTAGESTV